MCICVHIWCLSNQHSVPRLQRRRRHEKVVEAAKTSIMAYSIAKAIYFSALNCLKSAFNGPVAAWLLLGLYLATKVSVIRYLFTGLRVSCFISYLLGLVEMTQWFIATCCEADKAAWAKSSSSFRKACNTELIALHLLLPLLHIW